MWKNEVADKKTADNEVHLYTESRNVRNILENDLMNIQFDYEWFLLVTSRSRDEGVKNFNKTVLSS